MARLSLAQEEKKNLEKQLSDILGFVEQLQEVNTDGVEPFLPEFEKTPMREDEAQKGFKQEQALMNAPHKDNGFFVVPRVVEY